MLADRNYDEEKLYWVRTQKLQLQLTDVIVLVSDKFWAQLQVIVIVNCVTDQL